MDKNKTEANNSLRTVYYDTCTVVNMRWYFKSTQKDILLFQVCAATSKGKGEKSYVVGTTSEIGMLLKNSLLLKQS